MKKGKYKKKLIIFIATWCGAGFIPLAPGTFGSLSAIPILILLKNASLLIKIIVLFLIVFVGTIVSEKAIPIFKDNDPKAVVIDEVAGMLISAIFLPFEWKYIVPAFILFRLLDIIKPYPIRDTENIKGGFGIMADDILAGIITYGLMFILLIIWRHGNFYKFYSFIP